MKKLLVGLLMLLGFSSAFAAEIDHFVVQVNPDIVQVNEATDLIIKAVDTEGNIVQDYEGDVLIDVEELAESDVTKPNEGVYTFEPTDQGQKVFSKGLIFKQAGDFTIVVYDIIYDDVRGQAKITVKEEGAATLGEMDITSPIAGTTEKNKTVNVIGTSSVPNSTMEVYVDGEKATENITDENGDWNVYLDDLSEGEHSIYAQVVEIDGEVLAKTDEIDFTYAPASDEFFKDISVHPSNQVIEGTLVTTTVYTVPEVTSAAITYQGIGTFPMTKDSDGIFVNKQTFDTQGEYPIDLELNVQENSKQYEAVEQITVTQMKAVKEVRYEWDGVDNTKVHLEWNYVGDISNFHLTYGTGAENLNLETTVDTNRATLENLKPETVYYLIVWPVDAEGNPDGEESELVKILPAHAAACRVTGIKITTMQDEGKYYITWDKVEDALKYYVYKSEEQTDSLTDMQMLGETQENRWEYPFDNEAEKEIYNWYGVEAECEDGVKAQIDEVKKVKVGPMDTMIILALLAVLLFFGYKMVGYTRD